MTSEVGRKVVMMGGCQVCIVAIPNGEIRAIEHMLMPRNGFFLHGRNLISHFYL